MSRAERFEHIKKLFLDQSEKTLREITKSEQYLLRNRRMEPCASTWRDSDDSEDYDPTKEKSNAKRQVAADGGTGRTPKRESECVEEPAFDKPEWISESSLNRTFSDSLPELEEDLVLDEATEIDTMDVDVDVVGEQSGQGKATVKESSKESGLQVASKLEGPANQTDSSEESAEQQPEDDNTPISLDSKKYDEEILDVRQGIQGESNKENEEKQDNLLGPEASKENGKPSLNEGKLESVPEAPDNLQSKVGEEPVSGNSSGNDNRALDEKLEIGSRTQDDRDKDGGELAKQDNPGLDYSKEKEVESQDDGPSLQTPGDADSEAVGRQSRTEAPKSMVTKDERVKEKEGSDAETKPAKTAQSSGKPASDVPSVNMQEPQSTDGTEIDSKNTAAEPQAGTEPDHGIPKRLDMVDSQPGANSKAEDADVAQALGPRPQTKDAETIQSAETSEPCSWCDDFAYGLVGFEKHRPGPMCPRCVEQRSCIVKCTGHRTEPLDGLRPESFDFKAAYDSLNPGTGKREMKNPWCSLCPTPAFFQCATQPATSGHLKSTEPGSVMGCGLMLCESCNILIQARNDLAWVVSFSRSEDPVDGSRADVDYLLPGSEFCK